MNVTMFYNYSNNLVGIFDWVINDCMYIALLGSGRSTSYMYMMVVGSANGDALFLYVNRAMSYKIIYFLSGKRQFLG